MSRAMRWRRTAHGSRGAAGQVCVLLAGGLLAVVVGVLVLGAVARGMGVADSAQRAADLSALAGARAMHEAYPRLFEPAVQRGRPNPRHLEKAAYLALGRDVAARVAAANGAPGATVGFPDERTIAPVRIRVAVRRRIEVAGEGVGLTADAEAELAPQSGLGPAAFGSGGGYDGPLRSSHSGQASGFLPLGALALQAGGPQFEPGTAHHRNTLQTLVFEPRRGHLNEPENLRGNK